MVETAASVLAPDRRAAVEVVPGMLYVVGGNLPLDGRASWAPARTGRFQPANCYLVLDAEAALVVDPGLAYFEDEVVSGLRELVPAGVTPSVFLTRAQLDCTGNLGALAKALSLSEIYTGGMQNPMDGFDAVTGFDLEKRAAHVQLDRLPAGRPLPPDACGLEIVNSALRMLSTFWGYHAATKTLFTSDSFGHAVLDQPRARPIVDAPELDLATFDDVRAHLLATFEWLQYAETGPIVDQLRAMFAAREVEVIAPVRGCVLSGKAIVERHVALMIDVLASFPAGASA